MKNVVGSNQSTMSKSAYVFDPTEAPEYLSVHPIVDVFNGRQMILISTSKESEKSHKVIF